MQEYGYKVIYEEILYIASFNPFIISLTFNSAAVNMHTMKKQPQLKLYMKVKKNLAPINVRKPCGKECEGNPLKRHKYLILW